MTSVFMVLEVSGNYSIIVPVIVANTFAYVISRALQPTAIFDVLTRQDGLELPSMEEPREEGILRVEDAMWPAANPVLDAEETPDRVLQRVDGKPTDVMLVRLNPSGWSSVARHELEIMVREGKGDLPSVRLWPPARSRTCTRINLGNSAALHGSLAAASSCEPRRFRYAGRCDLSTGRAAEVWHVGLR